jgi:hypothetical protein
MMLPSVEYLPYFQHSVGIPNNALDNLYGITITFAKTKPTSDPDRKGTDPAVFGSTI